MNRIICLSLVWLFLITGIISCQSSETIREKTPDADSIIIWFEGKGINVEEGNSLFDELTLEAIGVINEIDGLCMSVNDTFPIYWHKQNDKCLEIVLSEPYRKYKQLPFEDDFVISVVLFPFNPDYASHGFITYSENSGKWYTWFGRRSTDNLLQMVNDYLKSPVSQ